MIPILSTQVLSFFFLRIERRRQSQLVPDPADAGPCPQAQKTSSTEVQSHHPQLLSPVNKQPFSRIPEDSIGQKQSTPVKRTASAALLEARLVLGTLKKTHTLLKCRPDLKTQKDLCFTRGRDQRLQALVETPYKI